MKINFTKKEYRLLLDIVYLGQWMMEAHETEPSKKNAEYETLIQKIYSYAKEMGCEELVDMPKDSDRYYTTRDYEESSRSHEVIDEYNEENFWEELISRLCERDAHADAKAAGVEISSIEEYWKFSAPHETKYADEFEKNGLSRLKFSET